ncbi:hypothetical protein IFM89_012077 [Coptis chinensis]|uniref:Plus3 domain-containing protein n=1 Tax=Coptis chinensis TaxID=261450 RepID=A0A835I1J8_9MAGN|nr:hypothetical protein IFM89_012077 [Coptis chinensis]
MFFSCLEEEFEVVKGIGGPVAKGVGSVICGEMMSRTIVTQNFTPELMTFFYFLHAAVLHRQWLCIVKNVDTNEPNKQYMLKNKSTHKYLRVTWGRSEARWKMAMISESPPLQSELDEWVRAMKKDREKKSVSSRPLNIAAEKKKRLRREMEKKGLDTKVVRLAEMNMKNRAENFKMASEKKAINTGLKEGEEGYDPFSRRWTRSRNYYV